MTKELQFRGKKPDRISVFVDRGVGVCDLVLYVGTQEEMHLSDSHHDCSKNTDGNVVVTETTLHLSESAPLVGFHGYVGPQGIDSLGLIFFDALDDICQNPSSDDDQEEKSAEAVEAEISANEKERAQALERILNLDSLAKERESREDIQRQIEELKNLKPIFAKDSDKPESLESLINLFKRLEQYDV